MKNAGLPLLFLSLGLLTSACASTRASEQTKVVEVDDATAAKSGGAGDGAVAKKDKDDELICQSEMVIGSNIPKKVCRTREQIERERRESQEAMRQSQQKSAASANR